MPWNRKNLTSLTADIEASLEVETRGDARFPAADRLVLARAVAGGFHGLHGHIAWAARQIIPSTADEEALLEHADWWGVRRKAATYAEGNIVFTEGTAGAVVPVGTLLQRDDGIEYSTTQEITLAVDGTGTAPAMALLTGRAGNCAPAVTVRLAVTLAGVRGTATVGADGFSLGTDQESLEELLYRFRLRVQQPPLGGAVHDYKNWALEIPGVTRAWAWPNWVGRGTVGVAIVADNNPDSIIPDAELVQQVQTYLEDYERCAPGCEPRVFAPTPKLLIPVVAGLNPLRPDVRRAVESNLMALLQREVEPGGALPLSHIREAISTAVGEYDHVLLEPTANILCAPGEMCIWGGMVWSEE